MNHCHADSAVVPLVMLQPTFRRYEAAKSRIYHTCVATLEEAQGVQFLCPKCFRANGGGIGTHLVLVWSESRGVPLGATPAHGRWAMTGTGFEDLSLRREHAPSTINAEALCDDAILVGECGWIGYIENGVVRDA